MPTHHQPNRTQAEKALAKALKMKKMRFLQNIHFNGYEVDFFLPEFKIAIEVDGFSHLSSEKQRIDLQKEQFLTAQGIALFRFTNQQIYNELAQCLSRLDHYIKSLNPALPISINTQWKERLRDFAPSKPDPQPAKTSIEDYFLSLDD